MSASLVGSEMCIRDSSGSPPRLSEIPRSSLRRWRALVASLGISGMSPVSYTHLTLPTICSV
eukprot:13597327-Alexandrium_andersonii.AAC.1